MSSKIEVDRREGDDKKQSFNLYLRLKKDADIKEFTSEKFNIFCNSVAIIFRVTWNSSHSMKILAQLKTLNGIPSQISLTVKKGVEDYIRTITLRTDLYEWQQIASYKCHIYDGFFVYMDLALCDKNPFKQLYLDKDFTDFVLCTENGESVPVHRNILAVSSPVLKSMLLGGWKEANQGYIQIPGISKTTLEHFKEYIYKYQLPEEPLDYAKLIHMASYYLLHDLPKLEKQGAEVMPGKFKPENIWEWLEYCVQHKHAKLLLLRLDHCTWTRTLYDLKKYFGFKDYDHEAFYVNKNLYEDTDFTDFDLKVGAADLLAASALPVQRHSSASRRAHQARRAAPRAARAGCAGAAAEDGISFHKNILAAHSPVMKTLLLSDWKEAKEGYVQIPDLKKATILQFKEYLYLKKIPEDVNDCTELFRFASHYKMPELETEAVIKISQSFEPENPWDWVEYCVQNRNGHVLVAILDRIVVEYKFETLKKKLLN